MNRKIKCLLIANRGEIAVRIIQTCRRLGIKSAVVYSDVDVSMPFVREADVAVALDGLQLSDTYLNVTKIIEAAKKINADAIHPGYGFLSENAEFAQKVIDEGLIWVGPNPTAIREMGLKANAKAIAEQHDVPVIPGYKGKEQDVNTLKDKALEIGFPVLLKASAGGGGKGMRIVYDETSLESAIESAQRESEKSFGDATLLIEKYFPSARHIEIQVLGDKHGNCIHLLERECSIQRRYQKIIEESPSPVLSESMRHKMGEAAVRLCKAIGYDNAGTVEFIYTAENEFYFLEVNTRLQVEHPVTEMIIGIDLVHWQLKIAEGSPITLKQEDIKSNGYALECRLYAENPMNNFLPATGKIMDWYIPQMEGLRVDSGICKNSEVTVHYDPMIAKIIVHAVDRTEAIRKMSYALREIRCQGLITNQRFLLKLLENEHFIKGAYDTHFIANYIDVDTFLKLESEILCELSIALLMFRFDKRNQKRSLLQNITSGWRNNFYQMQHETIEAEGEQFKIEYKNIKENLFLLNIDGKAHEVRLENCSENEIRLSIDKIQKSYFIAESISNQYFVQHPSGGSCNLKIKDRYPEKEIEKIKGGYEAPMPGEIFKILVNSGQNVEEGTPLLILVSMKMENIITASETGIVQDVFVQVGETVQAGKLLLKLGQDNSN